MKDEAKLNIEKYNMNVVLNGMMTYLGKDHSLPRIHLRRPSRLQHVPSQYFLGYAQDVIFETLQTES